MRAFSTAVLSFLVALAFVTLMLGCGSSQPPVRSCNCPTSPMPCCQPVNSCTCNGDCCHQAVAEQGKKETKK